MPDTRIRVAEDAAGALAYAIPCPPESLPAVRPEALMDAWAAARRAAAAGRWGPPRTLVFARAGAEPTVLAIADPDARAWAEAVDGAAGLGTLGGLSVCLRLLALVEVMARAPFLSGLFELGPDGVELHPALLRAAAGMRLDTAARLDAEALRRRLGRSLPAAAPA